jgi:hypothetical protein
MFDYPSLRLNVIPLGVELGTETFSFYRQKKDDRFVALRAFGIPCALSAKYDYLYTDFNVYDSADVTAEVSLSESQNFAKHYLNHSLYTWFEDKAYFRERNFIRNVVLYFKAPNEESGDKKVYSFDRYILRPTVKRFTNGVELTIMYKGRIRVATCSLLEYPGPSTDINKVVYERQIYRYNDFIDRFRNSDRANVYPVLNRKVAECLGVSSNSRKRANKVEEHCRYIHNFYEQFIRDPEFVQIFKPSVDGFLKPRKERLFKIPSEALQLRFGEGSKGMDPFQGLNKNGPYYAPKKGHVELFIIVHKEDSNYGNVLYTALSKGLGSFKGLQQFARIPINISEKNIVYTDKDDPVPEIEHQLSKTSFNSHTQYTAIYVSPFSRFEEDDVRYRVYYRIKELLLKYSISSQVIHNKSITHKGFKYFLPNIATALIAKTGGVPWTLNQQDQSELIIGIGAYRPKELDKTYLGSAFCFTNTGDFEGFDSFTSDRLVHLAGSLQKAIRSYRNKHHNIKRIVLHYYKLLNRKENECLMNAMKEMKLDIPLVVITIFKQGSRDLVLADTATKYNLPVCGTWYRYGTSGFLICSNTRYDDNSNRIKDYPFPIKIIVDVAGKDKEAEQIVSDNDEMAILIKQILQLGRLNWRTVSVNGMPVTITYPEMVARKFPYFEGNIIPAFGKKNMWFL